MAKKRDADGNIIDTPSWQANEANRPGRQPPQGAGANISHNPRSGKANYDAETVPAEAPPRKPRGQAEGSGSPYDAETVLSGAVPKDGATRIYRPGAASPSRPQAADAPTNAMDDPPVGWLVVTAGPGQGKVVTIGNGTNSIGRDASERLPLDFGDKMISRTGHAILTYDPHSKKFYIQHGGGTNLTYVDHQPVLAPQEMSPGMQIQIGHTHLRFVPLCGEHFDWDTPQGDN